MSADQRALHYARSGRFGFMKGPGPSLASSPLGPSPKAPDRLDGVGLAVWHSGLVGVEFGGRAARSGPW